MSHATSHNPNLFQWKRFTKKRSSENIGTRKESDIESWLRKVELATEKTSETSFSDRNSNMESRKRYPFYPGDSIMQTVDRLRDDDDAHEEAQELVNGWMNEKLRFDFLENEDETNCRDFTNCNANVPPGVESATHQRWYEDSEAFIQNYLKSSGISPPSGTFNRQINGGTSKDDVLGTINIYEVDENTVVQALMKKMMDKPVIKQKTMRRLKADSKTSETKEKDPRTTMQMRHKQVKEARLRRQKEEDQRKQDQLMKKEAKFKAQQILKQEEAQRLIRAKQEEEAIQLEMAKLRKEMIEQRRREEEAKKEKQRISEQAIFREEAEKARRRQELEAAKRERQKEKLMSEINRLEEKKKKIDAIMKKRDTENRMILHQCLSMWCKVVLSQRVKLGKAKAMSDWKYMQRAWIAWKTYTRNQKLDIEMKYHQEYMRETKLKEKRAINCETKRLLQKCFCSWKFWVRNEQERKEILRQQDNTKAKMRALLDAVASGNIAKKESAQPETLQSLDSNESSDKLLHFNPKKPANIAKPSTKKGQDIQKHQPGKPKNAWQVTRRDVKHLQPTPIRHLPDNSQLDSAGGHGGRRYDPYENRHKFQKEVIDQQRMLLQEQKRMIEEMQEQQRLQSLQNEIAVLKQNQEALSKHAQYKLEALPGSDARSGIATPRNPEQTPRVLSARSAKSNSSNLKKHPIVSKMEERAAERLKKRKELEEVKRKREEERVERLQEEEERKRREEQEMKEKELQAKREARRLQKKQEADKKAQQERMRELCKMADNHYQMTLLNNYGFLPWKKLVQTMERESEVAEYHCNRRLISKVLAEWKQNTDDLVTKREKKADELYRAILLRRGLRSWMKYGERMEILEEKAILHHNKILLKKFLKFWVDYTTDEKLAQWDKEARADRHNHARLLRRVFNVIRSHRSLLLREEERRRRLAEMRRKVTQLLPDFQHPRDSIASDVTDEDET